MPIAQRRAQMHLDTVCTMVDTDTVVMYANIVDTLSAFTIQRTPDGVTISDEAPFLEAAAKAMGIDKLRVIDTGVDPLVAEREQWDDGNNTLALAPGVVVAYERNVQTNARLRGRGHRGADHRGIRIGHRPRRSAVHVLSRRARRGSLVCAEIAAMVVLPPESQPSLQSRRGKRASASRAR